MGMNKMGRKVLIVLEDTALAHQCVEYFANTSTIPNDRITLLHLDCCVSDNLIKKTSLVAASALGGAMAAAMAAMKSDVTTESFRKPSASNRNLDNVEKHRNHSPDIVILFEELQRFLVSSKNGVPPENIYWEVLESEHKTPHAMTTALIEYIENNKVDLVVITHRAKEKGPAHEILVRAAIPTMVVPPALDSKIVQHYPSSLSKLGKESKSTNMATENNSSVKENQPADVSDQVMAA
jgi:hypothetical protein